MERQENHLILHVPATSRSALRPLCQSLAPCFLSRTFIQAQQLAFQCYHDRCCAIGHLQFAKKVQQVGLDRCFAQMKRMSDLFIARSLCDQRQYLEFARAESIFAGLLT